MKKIKNLQGQKRSYYKYAFLICLYCIFAAILAKRCYVNHRLHNHSVSCRAIILREEKIHSYHVSRPGFRYCYYFKGKERTCTYPKSDFKDTVDIGDTIDILVDPNDPDLSIPLK